MLFTLLLVCAEALEGRRHFAASLYSYSQLSAETHEGRRFAASLNLTTGCSVSEGVRRQKGSLVKSSLRRPGAWQACRRSESCRRPALSCARRTPDGEASTITMKLLLRRGQPLASSTQLRRTSALRKWVRSSGHRHWRSWRARDGRYA